jgi:hypothetical protein
MKETHSQLANFISNNCNLLRDFYKHSEYRKVMRLHCGALLRLFAEARIAVFISALFPHIHGLCTKIWWT